MTRSLRINTILTLIGEGVDLLIDLGCDHAYLGFQALTHKVNQVWNVDISLNALNSAQKTFKALSLTNPNVFTSDKCSFFCSNGFQKVPCWNQNFKVVLVCAGVGTNLILQFLTTLPAKVFQIICVPHKTLAQSLRKWVGQNNFVVVNERWIFDQQHFYEIITFQPISNLQNSLSYQTTNDYLFGLKKFYNKPINQKVFLQFWSYQLKKLLKIPSQHRNLKNEEQIVKIKGLLNAHNFNIN